MECFLLCLLEQLLLHGLQVELMILGTLPRCCTVPILSTQTTKVHPYVVDKSTCMFAFMGLYTYGITNLLVFLILFSSVLHVATGAGLSMPHTGHRLTSEDTLPMGEQNAASNSIPHTVSNAEARNMDVHRGTYPVSSDNSMGNQFPSSFARAEVHVDTPYITRQNSVGNQSSHAHSNVAATHGDTIHVTRESSVATMCSPIAENVETDKYRNRIPVTTITDSTPLRGSSSTVSTTDDILMGDASDHPLILSPEPGNIIRESSVGNQSSHVHSNVAVADKDNVHVTWESSVATKCSPIAENVVTNHDKIPVITISDNVPLRGSSAVSNTDDVLMVDAASDHPLMMSGDREVPFTYLASLSAKWAAMKEKSRLVQGKIKVKR